MTVGEAKNIMYVKITNFTWKNYPSSLRNPIFLDRIDKVSRQFSLLSSVSVSHHFRKHVLFSVLEDHDIQPFEEQKLL